jgi:hypothetical protein
VQVASRPYVLAAAALAAVSTVIVTPVVARQVPLAVRQMEAALVDVGIDNIPVNLFDDILNIPYNETVGGGFATLADSFLFTGTWWVPSSTNLWGVDPGDPTHIALIDNLIPFTAFTEGFTNSAGVYEPGLNYEFAGLLASELPVSSSCDAVSCAPMTPSEVLTGDTGYDRDIGFLAALMGNATDANGEPNGLFTNFFQVPLQDLIDGYKFQANPAGFPITTGEPTYDTGILNPGGAVNPETDASEPGGHGLGLLWGSTGNPFEGGTTGADNAMPWDGLNYQLNLLQPFQTLYDSLTQTPATDGVAGTGIDSFSFTDVMHTFENLEAGFIIDFDPYTAGSPACPGLCTELPASEQIPALVADIAKADPTNTTLANWVYDYNIDPTNVNEPTVDQINNSIALLQTGSYNFSPTELAQVDAALTRINPELPFLYTNDGIITDPNYLAYVSDPTTTVGLEGAYGGYDPNLVGTDFLTLLQDAGTSPVDPTLSADLQLLLTDFSYAGNPAALQAVLDGGTVAAAAAATPGAAVDPSTLDPTFSTDLSTLLAGLGSTVTSDAVSAALAEISAQITADFASFVPQSVLSLF